MLCTRTTGYRRCDTDYSNCVMIMTVQDTTGTPSCNEQDSMQCYERYDSMSTVTV